jgi:hypothetical protein
MRYQRILLVLTLLGAPALGGCLAPDAVPGGEGGSGGSTGTSAGGGAGYDLAWAKSYGLNEDFDKRALSVAASPDGTALVAGEFEGGLSISPLPDLPNSEGRDAFVAAFGADGTPAWSVAFAGLGEQRAHRALPAPGGGVVVAGTFTQTLFVDGTNHGGTPNGWDGFVAHIADDQSIDWLVRVSGPGDQVVHSIALTKSGEIVLGGYFDGTLQVGDLVTSEVADGRDFFIAKLDPAGQPLWGISLGGDPVDLGSLSPVCLLATGNDGGIHVAGTFTGTVRLGENLGAVGDQDVFVAKLDSTGQPLWGHAAGMTSGEQLAGGLAVSNAGFSVLSGHVRGQAQFDAQTTLLSDGPEPDAFLAVYNDSGNLHWARRYGSKAEDHGGAVAFDDSANILFTGQFRGSMSFGADDALDNNNAVSSNDDIFLATITLAGDPLSSAAFGKDGDQVATSVAATAGGDVLLAGWFRGIVDFGGGDLDALLGDDMFVARLTSQTK